MTSHAAVVARGMGKCCVAGCSAIRVHEADGYFEVGGRRFVRGETISLNGSTGDVLEGAVATLEPEVADEFKVFMEWADATRKLGVRANADVPRDAQQARKFGAEGIGLCRTEHMFFASERLPYVQQMILFAPIAKRLRAELVRLESEAAAAGGTDRESWNARLKAKRAELAEPQEKLDEALGEDPAVPAGRLLRPPEGDGRASRDDPDARSAAARVPARAGGADGRDRADGGEEGRRGRPSRRSSRSSLRSSSFTSSTRCSATAAAASGSPTPRSPPCRRGRSWRPLAGLKKEGVEVLPEIMIPLVGDVAEFRHQAAVVRKTAEEVQKAEGVTVPYLVGTMIEVPRAALTAAEIAAEAEFFSFGTNDLTQMTYGFSRDDAGKFLREYLDVGLLERDPFVSIDQVGVGQLVAMATKNGRSARPALKVGICGEHGGDPIVDRLLLPDGIELRQLLAVPRPDRPPRRGPSGARGGGRDR